MFLMKTTLFLFGSSLNASTRRSSFKTNNKINVNINANINNNINNNINIIRSTSTSTSTRVNTSTRTSLNVKTDSKNDFFKESTQSIQQFLSSTFNLNSNSNDPQQQPSSSSSTKTIMEAQNTIESFISSFNQLQVSNDEGGSSTAADIETMVTTYFDQNVEYTDTSFYRPVTGTDDLLKHFLLYPNSDASSLSISMNNRNRRQIVIDDIVAGAATDTDDTMNMNVCVQYHLEELLSYSDDNDNDNDNGTVIVPDSTGITFYTLHKNKIKTLFNVLEPPSPKPGNAGLKLLEAASTVLGKNDDTISKDDNMIDTNNNDNDDNGNIVKAYFDSWNERNMDKAIQCFTPDCVYEDLQYDTPFQGKDNMEQHLNNVARCLPSSFRFQIDDFVTSSDKNSSGSNSKVGVLWHVESNGDELPFTRGCSFYTTTGTGKKKQLIQTGVDIPEPAVVKSGAIRSTLQKFQDEPARFIPLTMWISYMYIVFLSDGILPGANAMQLEQRTWEEVRDLSLNFFLVSPLLHLPFAPVVHPMLEGVFNLLLAWAGMFAGFLSDERKDKPNLLEFGPIVVGMQFLTSAFLLPYLAFRNSEVGGVGVGQNTVYKEDITGSIQATVGEWKPLGGILGGVGSASIVWAFLARPEFGSLSERYGSFLELLSIDRVGSSFLVDLAIFALFQGWFIDDDMKRRGVGSGEMGTLKNLARVPFFGLAYYLAFRPNLPSREEEV